jgi:prepilin-type N-terminal cleavage/methylation domain-containing protein
MTTGRATIVGKRLSRQDGFTLVELLVAMSLMAIVMAVFGTTLASVQRTAMQEDRLGQSNDQARLALEQIDREMRSGNVLYSPAVENGSGAGALTSCTGCLPYYTMRIYTQTNADSRSSGYGNGYLCVMWQVDTQEQLKVRTWPPEQPEEASSWRIVATGVVNRTLGTRAFTLDPDPLKGNRTLNVTLAVNSDYGDDPGSTLTLHGAYTGRNTSYGYPVSVCQDAPT